MRSPYNVNDSFGSSSLRSLMMNTISRSWVRIYLLILIAGGVLPSANAQTGFTVIARVTNGIQPPQWNITDQATVTKIQDALSGLPRTKRPPEGALGPFWLVNITEPPTEKAGYLVGGGYVVFIDQAGKQTYYADTKSLSPLLALNGILINISLPDSVVADLDNNGVIDQRDINILLQDKGKPVAASACGVRCDLDGDGFITEKDAKQLSLSCLNPRCAISKDSGKTAWRP